MPSIQTYSIVQSDNISPNGLGLTRGSTEEEWVTKKKVEITTTKNIERKIHRQLVLEDGRVLDEEVPTVTIDRTEDKQIFETDHDEERHLDNHDNDMAVHSTVTTDKGDKFTTVKTTKDIKENVTRTEAVQDIGNIRSRELPSIINNRENIGKYIRKSNEDQNQLQSSRPRTVFSSRKHHVVTDKEDVQEREFVSEGKVKKEKIKTEEHIEYDSDDSLCSSSSSSSAASSHYELEPEEYKTRTEESFTEYFVKGKGDKKPNMIKVSNGPHYKSESKEGHKKHDNRWIQKNKNKRLTKSTHKQLTQVRSLDNETKQAANCQMEQNIGSNRMSSSYVDLRRMGAFDGEINKVSRGNKYHSQDNEERVYIAKVIQPEETPTVKMRKKKTDINYYTANRQSANFSSSGHPIRPPRAKEYTYSICKIPESKKHLLKPERPHSLNLTENYYFGDSVNKTGKYSYPVEVPRHLGRSYHSTHDLSGRHDTYQQQAGHTRRQHQEHAGLYEDTRTHPTGREYNSQLLPTLRQERSYHSANDLSKVSSSYSSIERPQTPLSVRSNYKLIPSVVNVKKSHVDDESNKHYNSTGNIYKSVIQERHRQVNSLRKNEPQHLSAGDISFTSGQQSSSDKSSNGRDINIEKKLARKSSGQLIFSSERPKKSNKSCFLLDNEARSSNDYSKQTSRTVPIYIQPSPLGSPSTRYRTRVVVTGQA